MRSYIKIITKQLQFYRVWCLPTESKFKVKTLTTTNFHPLAKSYMKERNLIALDFVK